MIMDTLRQSMDWRDQLTTDETGAQAEGDNLVFAAGEIDQAIAEMRRGVDGVVGAETALKGDF